MIPVDLQKWRAAANYVPSNKRTLTEGNLGAYLERACQEIEDLREESELRRLALAKTLAERDALAGKCERLMTLARAWDKALENYQQQRDCSLPIQEYIDDAKAELFEAECRLLNEIRDQSNP